MATALLGALLAPAGAMASGEAPVAVTDTLSTAEDVVLTANVIANDTDAESDPLHVTSAAPLSSAYGTLAIASDGSLTFTPKANWSGTVPRLWYFVNDGTTSTKGWIDITVSPVNDAPTAVDDTVTVVEDTATNVTVAVKANDTDPEGSPLAVMAAGGATGGTVAVVAGVVTFTPAANVCGTATGGFDYTISDGADSDVGHATVDVTCANDGPVAVDDAVDGSEDTALPIDAADLLANDTDVEDDELSIDLVEGALHGTVALEAGVVTFTPAADHCGAAEFQYTVTDGDAVSDPATVALDLDCVNDAPVAVDDTATVAQGPATSHDVAANDTDVDGDDLVVSAPVVDPAQGTATVVDNELVFDAADGFTGPAVIGYTVSDGTLTDEGTLTVTVVVDDDAPVVAVPTVRFGSGRVNESAPLLITWDATDAGVGVAGFEVQVRIGSGAWTTIYTGSARSATRFYGFGTSLQWQVRATDHNGNVSGWVQSAVRRLVAYQGGSPVARTGTWTTVASSGSSGTGYRYTTTAGRKATLTFSGIAVAYVAPKLSSAGYAKVSIDGSVTRHQLRASSTSLGQIVRTASWGTSGSHTIRVINDQGGRRTTLDAFVVLK